MPSHPSAEKRVRQTARRTAANKNRKSQIRTAVRKAEEAIAAGDKAAATAAVKLAEPALMRGVSKGVIHKNTGSRKVSRLNARLKTLKG
ncbi:MAG TPA: 30S ribosomal protein S20 [Micropepsaceae bacterium]|jgi:small subunit ribosomal protein S20|nr:30S ribosomal protein S20 [Micropepsaceae bacterium]